VSCPPKARSVVGVDNWPLLANGKTDYQQLLQAGIQ